MRTTSRPAMDWTPPEWQMGAIWAAGGTSAQEVAVFQAAEGASSEEIAQTLQT